MEIENTHIRYPVRQIYRSLSLLTRVVKIHYSAVACSAGFKYSEMKCIIDISLYAQSLK